MRITINIIKKLQYLSRYRMLCKRIYIYIYLTFPSYTIKRDFFTVFSQFICYDNTRTRKTILTHWVQCVKIINALLFIIVILFKSGVFFKLKLFKIISNYDQLKPIKHDIIKILRVGYIICHNTNIQHHIIIIMIYIFQWIPITPN